MNLTPGQQRLVFVLIVLALAGLGIYLIGGRGSGGAPAAAPSSSGNTTAPAPATSSSPDVPPTLVPSATPASTAGAAQIYQWLPFSPADLATAAKTTTAFAKAYVTWSYTESAKAYAATFNGLATTQETATLESGYSAPGLAMQRTAAKQSSTGSGAIDSIRSFVSGPASITFLVTITNTVTSNQAPVTKPNQYAITVAPSGGAWQVNDIELAQLGNQ